MGDDKLERSKDAAFLYTFLRKRSEELIARHSDRSYVLNLDASWGEGKTFFLERFRKQLADSGHLAVCVNAWKDDFADDPLIAVMAAINNEVVAHIKPASLAGKAWNVARRSGGKVALLIGKGLGLRLSSLLLTSGITTAIGETVAETGIAASAETVRETAKVVATETISAIETIVDSNAEAAISSFESVRQSIDIFRENLSKFLSALEEKDRRPLPLFVLVDELDRCRPPYAIAMLERIKHLFDTPYVVFVVATDSTQLVHSITGAYGQYFDASRYLKRFFDRSFVFEKPSKKIFLEHLMSVAPLDTSKLSSPFGMDNLEFLGAFFDWMETDLRSIEQIYDLLRTIATVWEEPVQLELLVLLPIIAGFHGDMDVFGEKISLKSGLKGPLQVPGNWKFRRHEVSDEGQPLEVETVVSELMKQMWMVAREANLAKIGRNRNGNDAEVWINGRFVNECQARYAGKPMRFDFDYPSIIRNYPQVVRQAGRLLQAPQTGG